MRRRRIAIGYRNYRSPRRFSWLQLLIVAIVSVLAFLSGTNMGMNAQSLVRARVTQVIDGDTISVRFSDGHEETIRLLGIDTPETHHPNKPVECFGPEAEQFTRSQLDGRSIELEYDVERKDKYGRTLAYIYVRRERFNDQLVRRGFARILNISPNTKYASELLGHELRAKKSGEGLWGSC